MTDQANTERVAIYLDHNATSPMLPSTLEAMLPPLTDCYANPSSLHAMGDKARALVDKARDDVAESVGVRPFEIIWTSGATESLNHIIRGACDAAPERRRIITTAVEHPATLDIVSHLEEAGLDVVRLGVDGDGLLDLDELREALQKDTAILSVLWVNNETGVIQDIEALGNLAHEHGALFHVDGVQRAGKGLCDLRDLPIDALSVAAHKFGGPKGSAFLYLRRGAPVRPFIWGGHHEKGRRGGTENVASICGIAAALLTAEAAWREHSSETERLRDKLQAALCEQIEDVLVVGVSAPRVSTTLTVCFRGIEGAAVVLTLSQRGVYCSAGSACTSDGQVESAVLSAMNVPLHSIHGAVRFSLSTNTTEQEIDHAIREIVRAVAHVRRVQA